MPNWKAEVVTVQKTIVCLFTCGQARSETCKCTADQNLSVAKVKTNYGRGGRKRVQLSSLQTDTPRSLKNVEE